MPIDTPPISARSLIQHPRFAEAMALVQSPLVRDLTDKYRPWRSLGPIARRAGIDPELAWMASKWRRLASWKHLTLKTPNGEPFVFALLGSIVERLHRIDRETWGGGSIALDHERGVLADDESQRRVLIRSMMDEAIDSSIIEGAKTSIRVARELLRSGRAPSDKSERMVANNYAAMRAVKGWCDRPLTPEMLVEVQRILTEGALDDDAPPDACGRLRRHDEIVVVEDKRTREAVHVPPDASRLPHRLKALCEFANARHAGEEFLHPVLKACILHFMIGYEHPFVDGNGRTARAVFYWCALRTGYRIFEFLPISSLIRKATSKYPRAFLDSETDDHDLTYFILYKLDIIRRSLDHFGAYLAEEEARIRQSAAMLRLDPNLNLRQRLMLQHALSHPKAEYTAKSQATTYGVTLMTARADLESLKRLGFLRSFKVGKAVHYVLDPSVPRRLARHSRK